MNVGILKLTRDTIKGTNIVHKSGGEDNLIINWHAAPNQPSVSPLGVHCQITIVTIPTGGKKEQF